MLIDATHAEATRVVVLDNGRLDELDVDTSTKKQIKGNIYLAKVVRVEPSLQAAFVDYGGNRHGFLAFGEIHPDYYQIPTADREKLKEIMADQQAEKQEDLEEDIAPEAGRVVAAAVRRDAQVSQRVDEESFSDGDNNGAPETAQDVIKEIKDEKNEAKADMASVFDTAEANETVQDSDAGDAYALNEPAQSGDVPAADVAQGEAQQTVETASEGANDDAQDFVHPKTTLEVVSESETEEVAPKRPNFFRRYKIQEVIRQGQVMLIQVVKEERGNKGAALTTYLSLAGRYSVLMPNNGKGGGVSRKITNAKERKEMRAIVDSLPIPQGMSVIVRTAGSGKKKSEIKRDYDYLIKTWMKIRDNTLESIAPKLIHEEGDIIKRSLRDGYTPDIEEIWVEGDATFKSTKEFMKILMPGQVKKIKQYKGDMPMFQAYQVENQLEAIHSNVVQLKSGGYIVIDQTEALVAVDVNSGRATKERDIEETALRTNLETCDELARQLKLRDLAGLIVIDFIDMDEAKNNTTVERRLKEALKKDRARIQVGKISGFGLMEMSRQRLHSSFLESSYKVCPHCGGKGLVRMVESCATRVMYLLEDAANRNNNTTLVMTLPLDVATYVLNHKRDHLSRLESKYSVVIQIMADSTLEKNTDYRLERLRENGDRAPIQPSHYNQPKEQREKADKHNKGQKEQAQKPEKNAPKVKAETEKTEEASVTGTAETTPSAQEAEKSNRRRDRNRRRREWKKNKRLARKMAQMQNQDGGENNALADEEGVKSLPAVREEGHNAVAEVTNNTPMVPFEENFTVVEQAHIGEVEDITVSKGRGRKSKAKHAAKQEYSQNPSQPPENVADAPTAAGNVAVAEDDDGAVKDVSQPTKKATAKAAKKTTVGRKKAIKPAPKGQEADQTVDSSAARRGKKSAELSGQKAAVPASTADSGEGSIASNSAQNMADDKGQAPEKPAKKRGGWWNKLVS